jgi:hypothetical protein
VLKRLIEAALSPQVLVAALLLIGAGALLLSVPRSRPTPPPVVNLTSADDLLTDQDVRLVLVDTAGLEWQRDATIAAPTDAPRRFEAILAALREALLAESVWPAGLPTPGVYVETFDRAVVAVVDVAAGGVIEVSVAQEQALVRAIDATAAANGIDSVRYLRGGQHTETFLGHVAVPSTL